MREVAQPVSTNDEHLDYVPTQAVAEFLAHHYTFNLDGRRTRIDAIVYKSAQNGAGRNIALLSTAGRVRISPRKSSATAERSENPSGELDATAGLIVDPTSIEVRRAICARLVRQRGGCQGVGVGRGRPGDLLIRLPCPITSTSLAGFDQMTDGPSATIHATAAGSSRRPR